MPAAESRSLHPPSPRQTSSPHLLPARKRIDPWTMVQQRDEDKVLSPDKLY